MVPALLMPDDILLNYAINVSLAVNLALRSEAIWQVGPVMIPGLSASSPDARLTVPHEPFDDRRPVAARRDTARD